MLIREAREADIPKILELYQALDGEEELRPAQALEIWHKTLQWPYHKIFVAEEEAALIGTCQLAIFENLSHHGARVALAESMVVHPEWRNRGVGTEIMKFIMERAREEKCYKLMLSSNQKRVDAHRFYGKLGFQQHGISFLVEVGPHD
ncbi:GNAT family N-acetyltransferase [Candidatus Formimonas warabiya]|uniref:GNAT family N-acetyltransferase n=1 Tax=Formimonas warabiya TaxID=1761012 RepID=A0A3G1KVT0_FORW1|nr:GNAT family N-acetyltransferase [Candidatus Formimonas warabiya]ATW26643.1 GNAT family N-acetyltransferase [Candidatus Formimonas warabiya]